MIIGTDSQLDSQLRVYPTSLRKYPSSSTLDSVLQHPKFIDLVTHILSYEAGTNGEYTVAYLKDVSVMLSLVKAVRECEI